MHIRLRISTTNNVTRGLGVFRGGRKFGRTLSEQSYMCLCLFLCVLHFNKRIPQVSSCSPELRSPSCIPYQHQAATKPAVSPCHQRHARIKSWSIDLVGNVDAFYGHVPPQTRIIYFQHPHLQRIRTVGVEVRNILGENAQGKLRAEHHRSFQNEGDLYEVSGGSSGRRSRAIRDSYHYTKSQLVVYDLQKSTPTVASLLTPVLCSLKPLSSDFCGHMYIPLDTVVLQSFQYLVTRLSRFPCCTLDCIVLRPRRRLPLAGSFFADMEESAIDLWPARKK